MRERIAARIEHPHGLARRIGGHPPVRGAHGGIDRHTPRRLLLLPLAVASMAVVGIGVALLISGGSSREEVARGHLEKLASDVGHPPLARYLAPHQPEVEAGEKPLATHPLDAAPQLQVVQMSWRPMDQPAGAAAPLNAPRTFTITVDLGAKTIAVTLDGVSMPVWPFTSV